MAVGVGCRSVKFLSSWSPPHLCGQWARNRALSASLTSDLCWVITSILGLFCVPNGGLHALYIVMPFITFTKHVSGYMHHRESVTTDLNAFGFNSQVGNLQNPCSFPTQWMVRNRKKCLFLLLSQQQMYSWTKVPGFCTMYAMCGALGMCHPNPYHLSNQVCMLNIR